MSGTRTCSGAGGLPADQGERQRRPRAPQTVEFGPTDYCTGRVARCHRALHLAEAFRFTGYFTKLQLQAGPVLAWRSSH